MSFSNVSKDYLSKVVAAIDPKIFEGYEHDYSQYNPADRPGEQEFLDAYDPSAFGVSRDDTSTTADNVILCLDEKGVCRILLINRGGHPFKGCWAHPGGFIDFIKDDKGNKIRQETTPEAAARELEEETTVVLPSEMMTFVKKYDTPGRDPRMNIHMNVHVVILEEFPEAEAADDAQGVGWFPIEEVFDGTLDMAFDHKQSIKDALQYVLDNAGNMESYGEPRESQTDDNAVEDWHTKVNEVANLNSVNYSGSQILGIPFIQETPPESWAESDNILKMPQSHIDTMASGVLTCVTYNDDDLFVTLYKGHALYLPAELKSSDIVFSLRPEGIVQLSEEELPMAMAGIFGYMYGVINNPKTKPFPNNASVKTSEGIIRISLDKITNRLNMVWRFTDGRQTKIAEVSAS